MALLPIKLGMALSSFVDSKSPFFVAAPSSIPDAADKWTNAFHGYMSLVSPPAPALMSAAQGAKAVMYTSILSAFTTQSFNTLLPNILLAYATTLALGFAPNYIAIPPISPPALAPVFARTLNGGSAMEFVAQLVLVIDAWMRTGTASLVTPTGTLPPIPWL